MPNSVDFSGKPFHFIGIGGIGMSALAYILAKRELPVSGSDVQANHITQRLASLGACVFGSQNASNFDGFDDRDSANGKLPQVICSTAIDPNNAEYRAALDLGCPIFHRSDLLAALMGDYDSIAVAGTHGKTTTSSLMGFLLLQAGLDPTIVVGGEVEAWGGNARLGQGKYLVAEADESDGSLVKFAPKMGIVTNIELDHPDRFGSLDEVVDTFKTFASRCDTLIGCLDCPTVRDRLRPAVGYSLNADSDADYTVDRVAYSANGTRARVRERGVPLGELELQLLGQHNLSNALAVVAVGRLLGLDFETIAAALKEFTGARRRFELRGEANNITFIDDYAHHPSEISVTLAAARLQARSRRVVAVFQPHRYSRTAAFLDEFSQCFADADRVVLTDIYSAGEANKCGITGEKVRDRIAKHHSHVSYCPTLADTAAWLRQNLRPGDFVLFLGAGNLNSLVPDLVAYHDENAIDSIAS